MMTRKIVFSALMLMCGLLVFGQAKPRLGILPFIGGPGGEGDTFSTLLSYQSDILGAFTVVPRTNAVTAMVNDESFQLSGYPDSDTLSRIGRMLNVDFVVSGYIRYLGDQNIVIANVVNVGTSEQTAGIYREYRRSEEIPGFLPDMAKVIINATRQNTSSVPKLAVAPINAGTGVSTPEAETLAQVLAVEISNSGKYVILPRSTALQAAMKDLDFQTKGYYTPGDEAKALGRAVNAKYVLITEVHSLGSAKMFTASIFNADDGSSVADGSRNYWTLNDGVPLMADLANTVSPGVQPPAPLPAPVAPPVPAPVPQPAPQPAPSVQTPPPAPAPTPQPAPEPVPQPAPVTPPAPPPQAQPPAPAPQPAEPIHVEPAKPAAPQAKPAKQPLAMFTDPAHLWTVGVSVGTAFTRPWVIGTVHGTIAPIKHAFLELGGDFGFISGSSDVKSYYAITPFAHLAYFMPFNFKAPLNKGGWYVGAGASYMMAYYEISAGSQRYNIFAIDATAGVNLLNMIDVSYTLRVKPDFKGVSNKLSVGYVYRF